MYYNEINKHPDIIRPIFSYQDIIDNQNADFSLMLENYPERIKIDSVLQKAMIDVDEKGIEAAAATVAVLTKSALSVDEEVIEFRADKPFTYYILDDSGNVYFAGRYVKAE